MDQMREISLKRRLLLLAVAWGVTVLVAVLIVFPGIGLLPFCFAGICLSTDRFFGHAAWFNYLFSSPQGAINGLVPCLLYSALTIGPLVLKRRGLYFALYAVLCLLLILGLEGLYEFAHWRM